MSDIAIPENLTRNQRRAVNVWSQAKTMTEVATMIGVNPSTLHRWRRESSDFRAAIQALQGESLQDATLQLVSEQSASIDTLAMLRDDPDSPPQVRRGSARDLMDLSARFVELQDLEARLSELEQRLL